MYDVTVTTHYVMITNKLHLHVRTDEYIILCKFDSHTISAYRVTGVGPPKPSPGPQKPKKVGLNRVKKEKKEETFKPKKFELCSRHKKIIILLKNFIH